MKCPSCGRTGRVYRSRNTTNFDKSIMALTPFKMYRCHDCNWRGWMVRFRSGKQLKINVAKNVNASTMITILAAVILALFIIRFINHQQTN